MLLGCYSNMALKATTRRTRRVIRTPTCKFWLAGRCNRNPCRFRHRLPSPPTARSYAYSPKALRPHSSVGSNHESNSLRSHSSHESSQSICNYRMNDNFVHGEQCQNLHSWSFGDGISFKIITGITFPVGTDKLDSGSSDGTLRVLDCVTGRCVKVINFGSEITSLISEGAWIFAGVKNAVKVLNVQTAAEFTLDGPKGQVLSMVTCNDNTLFAGAEDGVIYAWRGTSDAERKCPFELVLCGHTKAVTCLTIGGDQLFSGSMDHTIKVWDVNTLDCIMTLGGHSDTVTSLICWDTCLISSSLDSTCKFWTKTEEGKLEVEYTHIEENGILAVSGMNCSDAKNPLFVSCRDGSVHTYELPVFSGQLFAPQEVESGSVEMGPDGLFFTGDATGLITVWKWLGVPKFPSLLSYNKSLRKKVNPL